MKLTSIIEKTINSECAQLAGQLEAARLRQEKQEFKFERQDIMIGKLEIIMNKIAFAQAQQDSALNFIRRSQENTESRLGTVESSQQYTESELRSMGSREFSKAQIEELKSLPVLSRIETSQVANVNKLDDINTQLKEAVRAWTKLAEEYSSPREDDLEEGSD